MSTPRASFAACFLATCFLMTGAGPTAALAQSGSYPTVMGFGGRAYGPTQAEYQYRLQYGRPSPGSNGSGLQFVNGYPGTPGGGGRGNWPGWGFGPQVFMGFDPFTYPQQGYIYYPSTARYNSFTNYNFGAPATGLPPLGGPVLGGVTPPVLQPLPGSELPGGGLPGGLPGSGLPESGILFGKQPTQFGNVSPSPEIIPPSTPKAQENSFQFQTQGDLQFQMMNYLAASERYRKAIDAARDRPDPRYRLAVSLAARGRYLEAVDQMKLATAIDPTFFQHSATLDEVFGAQNAFEKARVKERVAEWTLQDVRDPNRLFLLGAFLYLDNDPQAQTILETAVMLTGQEPFLLAFLAPRAVPVSQPAAAGAKPQAGTAAPEKKATPAPPVPRIPSAPAETPVASPSATGSGVKEPVIPPLPTSDAASGAQSPLPVPRAPQANPAPLLPPPLTTP